jgi:hypothetical protein
VLPRVLCSSGPVDRNIKEHLAVVSDDGASAARNPSVRKRNDEGIWIVALEVTVLRMEERMGLVQSFGWSPSILAG